MNHSSTSNTFTIPTTPTIPPPTIPPLQSILWTPGDIVVATFVAIILAAIILATIVGNALVITAIFSERNLRIVGNYLIASLAVADLLVASLVMPILAVKEISHRWVLGAVMCEVWISMDVLCCTASILHLLAIAVDRYWAVTRASYIHDRPVKPIVIMIILSWVISTLLCIPSSFVWRNDLEDDDNDDNQGWNHHTLDVQNGSLDQVPDGDALSGSTIRPKQRSALKSFNNPDDTGLCKISQDWGYTVYSTMAAFFIPLIAIIIIYAKVYRVARRRIRKKQFTPAKSSTISGDEQKVGESTDEGCLEGSLNSNQFQQDLQSSDFDRSVSDFRPVNLKKRRRIVGVFACFCCKSKTQDKNGFNKQYTKGHSAALRASMKPLNNDQREATVSCFSLTPTNQSTQVFSPSFATSATATTTLTTTDQRSQDVVDGSYESLGRIHTSLSRESSKTVESNRNEQDALQTELDEPRANEMAEGNSSTQTTNRSNFLHEQSANNDEESPDEKDFLKREEENSEEEGSKSKRPIKRHSPRDVRPVCPSQPSHNETSNDPAPSGNSYKLTNRADVMTPDKQFTCPPKRSITFQTIESGLHSSAEEFADHNEEEQEDQAFYDETADDGDDETDINDKDDDFPAAKRLHSTEFLKSAEPLNMSVLPRSRHNSIQFPSQPLKEEQKSGKSILSCQTRHSSHKRHPNTGLQLHLRQKPQSRKQRPTRQAKERRAKEKREQARERKAARTLAIITGSFVICWLPFFITALVMPFCGDSCYMPPLVESIIAWLGYLNSGLNPVIYTIFNLDFRMAFKKIVFGKRWKT